MALAIHDFAIPGFDYSHLIKWNLTLCLYSNIRLAICGFDIHIQIFLEPIPASNEGNLYWLNWLQHGGERLTSRDVDNKCLKKKCQQKKL